MITVSMPQDEYRKNLADAIISTREEATIVAQQSLANVIIAIIEYEDPKIILPPTASDDVGKAIKKVRDLKAALEVFKKSGAA